MKLTVLLLSIVWATHAYAEPDISVNGLFIGKAIIKIDGKPVMFFEGDKKQGVKLISANEDRAVVEINGKRQTMSLDLSIANEYSKPVQATLYKQTDNQLLHIEMVHQTNNLATFMVEYKLAEDTTDWILIAQTMVNKKAVEYASYNYVPLKAGQHKTHISIGIKASAPAEYQSDHILINFASEQTQSANNPDTAKIIQFTKNWQH